MTTGVVDPIRLIVWTLGHSTRSLGELTTILEAYDIELVADVRRFPRSRRLPQFAGVALEQSLAARGIGYHWLPALGGRRRPAPESPNVAWRHPAFRAYADHVETEDFASGLFELLMLAHGLRTVIMCAEVLWWQCHRSMIADALKAAGTRVLHIMGEGKVAEHPYTAPARVNGETISYHAS